jgi:hypothetical protein
MRTNLAGADAESLLRHTELWFQWFKTQLFFNLLLEVYVSLKNHFALLIILYFDYALLYLCLVTYHYAELCLEKGKALNIYVLLEQAQEFLVHQLLVMHLRLSA